MRLRKFVLLYTIALAMLYMMFKMLFIKILELC